MKNIYRAWCASDKKMRHLGFYIEQATGLCYYVEDAVRASEITQERQVFIYDCGEEEPILMLMTPIQDMNMEAIYVGDIVKDRLTGRIHEVKFGFCKKYAFTGFYCETADGYQATLNGDYGKSTNSQIEVIGNIHEHPELLNT